MLPAALFAAALTTVALDDVPMVLLVTIALTLVGIFVYVIYAEPTDANVTSTRSRNDESMGSAVRSPRRRMRSEPSALRAELAT